MSCRSCVSPKSPDYSSPAIKAIVGPRTVQFGPGSSRSPVSASKNCTASSGRFSPIPWSNYPTKKKTPQRTTPVDLAVGLAGAGLICPHQNQVGGSPFQEPPAAMKTPRTPRTPLSDCGNLLASDAPDDAKNGANMSSSGRIAALVTLWETHGSSRKPVFSPIDHPQPQSEQ